MGVRVKRYPGNGLGRTDFDSNDDKGTIADRETTVDGQTFHWGPNEVRNFLDDSVGIRHAAFKGGTTIIQEDSVPFGTSRF